MEGCLRRLTYGCCLFKRDGSSVSSAAADALDACGFKGQVRMESQGGQDYSARLLRYLYCDSVCEQRFLYYVWAAPRKSPHRSWRSVRLRVFPVAFTSCG